MAFPVLTQVLGDNSGTPKLVAVNSAGEIITTAATGAEAAFGELLVQQPVPKVQSSFTYGIQPTLLEQTFSGTGSSSSASGLATASTGATAGSTSSVHTRTLAHYDPGLGLEALFTGMFATSPAGTQAWVGLIDEEDGCAFGVQGGALSLIHRRGGLRQIATLSVTVASGGAGSIDIELDGTTVNVPIAGALTVGEVITAIASADYSTAGGWQAAAFGSGVSFVAIHAEPRSGAYSFTDNATGAVGAFAAPDVLGVTATDDAILSSAWNIDKADGTGALPAIDPTKINIYRCVFAYLGGVGIKYSIWNPDAFAWNLVHAIPWGNEKTEPLFGDPTMPLSIMADNLAVASDATAASSSMAAHLQGMDNPAAHSVFESDAILLAAPAGAETVIGAYHVKSSFNGRPNKLLTAIESLGLANDAGKSAIFRIYLSPQVTGTLTYSDVGIGLWEVAKPAAGAVAVVPGTALITLTFALGAGVSVGLGDITGSIPAGAFIVIAVTTSAGGGGDMTVAPTWRVEF